MIDPRNAVTLTVVRLVGGVALSMLLASLSAAQGKDTVWTTVSTDAAGVSVAWHKNHPWNADLSRAGAQLVARYQAEGRVTSEVISTAAATGTTERRFRFALPSDLRSRPQGPICLFVQLPNRRVLPIRRADKQDSDTAGFRDESWERHVRARGDLRAAQARVADADRSLVIATHNVTAQQAVVSRRGWATAGDCDRIVTPVPSTAAVAPYDVVSPQSHDDVTRRVCVHRVWVARTWAQGVVAKVLVPAVAKAGGTGSEPGKIIAALFSNATFTLPDVVDGMLSAVSAESPVGDRAGRLTQAAEFRRDWQRLAAAMALYEPHVGTSLEMLELPSTAPPVALRVFGRDLARAHQAEWAVEGLPPASPSDILGIAGVMLDAYSGCLEDVRKQLRIKWDSWQSLASSAPRRAEAAHEFFVRECRQELTLLQQLTATRDAMQAQSDREQQALRAIGTPPSPSGSRTVLNASSCQEQK